MGVGSSGPLPAGCETSGVRVAVKERYHAYLPPGTNLNAVLNEEKVKLVHDHWNSIADEREPTNESRIFTQQSRISIFYDAFYEKLFQEAPETREMFEGNMVRQSRALVKMVSWLCNLEVTPDLVSRLEALADRHVDIGCLPSHYYSGSLALQHALRVATEDEEVDPAVMEAWRDLYSFVMLIVIPRTALLLEEAVRTAGPMSAMLRSTPISGTRVKRLKTPPPVRGSSAGLARSAPPIVDGEWLGATARRADGAARVAPIVRSGSGSFTRSVVLRRRSHKAQGNMASAGPPGLQELEPLRNADAVARWGGASNLSSTGHASIPVTDTTGGLTPGDSPSSISSLRLHMSDSGRMMAGCDSVCPSPDESTSSAGRRRRKSKILMGLGRRTTGGGNDGNERGSPRASSSIRVRARNVFVRSRNDADGDFSDSKGSGSRRGRAGSAAPLLPFGIRHRHSRGNSAKAKLAGKSAARETATLCNGRNDAGGSGRSIRAGGSEPFTRPPDRGISASKSERSIRTSDGEGTVSANFGERSLGGSGPLTTKSKVKLKHRNADLALHNRSLYGGDDSSDNQDSSTMVPSPARSTVSLPGVSSWGRSLQLVAHRSSRKLRERTAVAPTSESPSAVFLGSLDFDWTGAHGSARADTSNGVPRTGQDVDKGQAGGVARRQSPEHDNSGNSRQGSEGNVKSNQSSSRISPLHDLRMEVHGDNPRLARSPRAAPTATGAEAEPPSPAPQTPVPTSPRATASAGIRQSVFEPFHLPASSTARMESLSSIRRAKLGRSAGVPTAVESEKETGSVYRETSVGKGDSTTRQAKGVEETNHALDIGSKLSPAREKTTVPSASGCSVAVGMTGRLQAPLQSAVHAVEPTDPTVLPMTPGMDGQARRVRLDRSAPSPSPGSRRGSRRNGRRLSSGSSSRNPDTRSKSERDWSGESRRRASDKDNGKSKPPSSRDSSRKEAAEAKYGFLSTEEDTARVAERQKMWQSRKLSSSGAEIDLLEANALAYRESKERGKTQPQEVAQELLQQQRGKEGTRPWMNPRQPADASNIEVPVPLTLPPAIAAAAGGSTDGNMTSAQERRENSPSPEELVFEESRASDARNAVEGVPPFLSGGSGPAGEGIISFTTASASENSPLPHMDEDSTFTARIGKPPLLASVASPAPNCSSPFFAEGPTWQAKTESTDIGIEGSGWGVKLRDSNTDDDGKSPSRTSEQTAFARDIPLVGNRTRRGEQTPPMWVSRRTLLSRASARASPPRPSTINNAGVTDGVSIKSNTPPASPPPQLSWLGHRGVRTLPASSARSISSSLRAMEESAQSHAQLERLASAKRSESTAVVDCVPSLIGGPAAHEAVPGGFTEELAAASKTVPMNFEGYRLGATSEHALVLKPAAGAGPHFPEPAFQTLRPRSLGRSDYLTHFPLQPHGRVERSTNRPMSLPPADDGDGDNPEPDLVSGGKGADSTAGNFSYRVAQGHNERSIAETMPRKSMGSLSARALAAAADERRAKLHALHSPMADDEAVNASGVGVVMNLYQRRCALTAASDDSRRALSENELQSRGSDSRGVAWALPSRGRTLQSQQSLWSETDFSSSGGDNDDDDSLNEDFDSDSEQVTRTPSRDNKLRSKSRKTASTIEKRSSPKATMSPVKCQSKSDVKRAAASSAGHTGEVRDGMGSRTLKEKLSSTLLTKRGRATAMRAPTSAKASLEDGPKSIEPVGDSGVAHPEGSVATRSNGFVEVFNAAGTGNNTNSKSNVFNKDKAAPSTAVTLAGPAKTTSSNVDGTGRSASGSFLGGSHVLSHESGVAPSSNVFVAQGREPKGRVAATAASFVARGRRGPGGGGRAVSGRRGGLSRGIERASSERRVGAMEGLAFGSVRAKASAWGKAWRS